MKNNSSKYKLWTVLIYANGNSDLEPEISKSLLDMERIGAGTNANVIVQLARAPYELVKTVRPNLFRRTDIDGDWSGVRRYLVKEEPDTPQSRNFQSVVLDDLGDVNMADPSTLNDFIIWGTKKFPSKHIMLILAGHGAGFMGILPDYTLKCPQIMSVNGVNVAINKATEKTGKKVDILLLDSCYMNMIETIYELGIGEKSPDYLITPQISPIEGLPYKTIMELLRETSKKDNIKIFAKNLVYKIDKTLNKKKIKLKVFRLNKFLLILTKITISNISKLIIKDGVDIKKYATKLDKGFPAIDLCDLINILNNLTSSFSMLINIFILRVCIKFIQVALYEDKSNVVNSNGLFIFTPDDNYFKLIEKYYSKMSFTDNNKWIFYLSGKKDNCRFDDIPFKYTLPLPENMPIEGIKSVIISYKPNLSQNDLNVIIDDLGWSDCTKLQ